MEKLVARWAYLFGLVLALTALGWRMLNFFGIYLGNYIPKLNIYAMTLYKGALLLLLLSIASANYAWVNRERS